MYKALAASIISYGITSYGRTYKTHLEKIYTLQIRLLKVEGVTRSGRRLSSRSQNIESNSSSRPEDVDVSSIRPRSARRREEYSEREVRARTRSRPQEVETSTLPVADTKFKSQNDRNERFNSRKTYSRTRNRGNDEETKKPVIPESTPTSAYTIRSRARHGSRKAPTPPTVSSTPTIDESKIEVINSNLEDINKLKFNKQNSATQFRRRSSTSSSFIAETEPRKGRSRISPRVDNPSSAPDLDSAGTTNDISVSFKAPTTARSSDDIRSSRKLRYKTRLSDTDSNLTGEGLPIASNENTSSQNKETITSQSDIHVPNAVVVPESTESAISTTTAKRMKVVRRPLNRGGAASKPTKILAKKKSDDEISEDDNYPESFKALLAKNASTPSSSQSDESLSVKASQIVYNTYSPPSQTIINTETEKSQNNSRFRSKTNAEENKIPTESVTGLDNKTLAVEEKYTEKKHYKRPEYKPRPTFAPRNRQSSLSTTTPGPANSNSEKTLYKFNRKFKITTESPNAEKAKRVQNSDSFKKPLARPSYYTRRRNSNKSDITTTEQTPVTAGKDAEIKTLKPSSYRTSYYARLRNNRNNTTESPKKEITSQESKEEVSSMKPVLYNSVTNTMNDNNIDNKSEQKNEIFVIAVTSKESQEKSFENEVTSTEKDINEMVHYTPTTSRYHSSYKDLNTIAPEDEEEEIMVTSGPPIRNLVSRQFGRGRKYENGISEEPNLPTISPPSESNLKGISDSYAKTTTPSTNEVEGEEIQLGPDTNAISFTQTRRTLSSADLRLSESVVKSSHVMNVEASNHSPSVTVSIFDALADILTSTPRSRLSSTSEVSPTTDINFDVKQTYNGVSNNVNVNTVTNFASLDTTMSISHDIGTDIQSVQITGQTTPTNVINRMLVKESITPSRNEDMKETSENTPINTLSPIPTTPFSARRPFAFKVLYTETETSTDMTSSPSYQPSTDNPTTVHNTLSDLLVPNNHLVSVELTSMLSNNIRDILKNMNDTTKSKVSVEMINLLNSLIPRAVGGLSNNVERVPETTPYSLEAIRDTDINIEKNSANYIEADSVPLQNVMHDISVNMTVDEPKKNTSNIVNKFDEISMGENNSVSQSTGHIFLKETKLTSTTTDSTIVTSTLTSKSALLDDDTDIVNTENNVITTTIRPTTDTIIIDKVLAIPFFTNAKISDFTLGESGNLDDLDVTTDAVTSKSTILSTTTQNSAPLTPLPDVDMIDTSDPSKVSPMQLWILSQKANVLKMIEDLIKQHHNDITLTPSLTESNNDSISVSISQRLTEVMNDMKATTTTDENNLGELISSLMTTTVMTTDPNPTTPMSITDSNPMTITDPIPTIPFSTTTLSENTITSKADDGPTSPMSSTMDMSVTSDEKSRSILETTTQAITQAMDLVETTTSFITNDPTTTTSIFDTTKESHIVGDVENDKITENVLLATTSSDVGNTTPGDENTTLTSDEKEITVATSTVDTSIVNIATQSTPPKRDYVIFGILPNNTVTKQIRTEKPGDENMKAVFKFIPIDEVSVQPQNSNVLKLATKATSTSSNTEKTDILPTTTDANTLFSQVQMSTNTEENEPTTTVQTSVRTPFTTSDETTASEQTDIVTLTTTESTTFPPITNIPLTTETITSTSFVTTEAPQSTTRILESAFVTTPSSDNSERATTVAIGTASTTEVEQSNNEISTVPTTSVTVLPTTMTTEGETTKYEDDALEIQNLLTSRSAKSYVDLNKSQTSTQQPATTTTTTSTPITNVPSKENDEKLLESLLLATGQKSSILNIPNLATGSRDITTTTASTRSIEEDIKQFEEDTKLLKALLQATGQNPNNFNIPSINKISPTTKSRISTTLPTQKTITTTPSIEDDIKKFQEDAKLLQILLQATGQDTKSINLPIISSVTSNVRMASKPLTPTLLTNPTTTSANRPVYVSEDATTPSVSSTSLPITTTFQPKETTENLRISTTFPPFTNQRRRVPTTTESVPTTTTTTSRNFRRTTVPTARQASGRFTTTTEVPSTSTFSVEEDVAFLKNLKSVLTTNNIEDPETALANRIIALAVEKSLNEITTSKNIEAGRDGKSISNGSNNRVPTTTVRLTTTTTTTTTPRPTTTLSTPSIEEDIKQFEEDTKLLKALLKATGQDPAKFNIPTIANPALNGAQETTTPRTKLTITGQTPDEALKLLQKSKASMVSEATAAPISLSTEYGKSQDALLAALLKEQGFGPTTASSLDEQLRLAALLNQVVVTPKARRVTTTPEPPPPPPRRPILDGLAWLWQQWRETGPGPGGARPRRPAPEPAMSSAPTATRTNWFGSGPFTGNAGDTRDSSNRVPLEPPAAVAAPAPGRGQLVSAAINVTRAFSQFLGAAIQGAAQTVQSVIRAGQRAANDVYVNGSG
ncbi:unnamed protein product [Plutella xylostella]|uniref:(diamondback moth) hypothetical protein n=1 Tax=Plutella xylostella TaxID=51655 RepID=A0A8S4D698_PLUXY|nr:unnamed protein product [Plutella xylostella]